MMRPEFASLVREYLIDAWGEKAFGPGIVDKLWSMVGGIPSGDFRQALHTLMMTCNRAPQLGQIFAQCQPALVKLREERKREAIAKLGPACNYCQGGGWIFALSREDPRIEACFMCTFCKAASIRNFKDTHGARYWTHTHETNWIPKTFDEKGYGAALAFQKEFCDRTVKAQREKDGTMAAMAERAAKGVLSGALRMEEPADA